MWNRRSGYRTLHRVRSRETLLFLGWTVNWQKFSKECVNFGGGGVGHEYGGMKCRCSSSVATEETERKVHALTFCFQLYDHNHLQGLITAAFVFVASGSANDREWSVGGLFREWGFNVMFCVYLVTKEMGFMGIWREVREVSEEGRRGRGLWS